jgi:hypothetical protein
MVKLLAIFLGGFSAFLLIIVGVIGGVNHYMPAAATAKYTTAEFSSISKKITTKDECIAAIGEPDERHVHSGAGGVIVGEQWVYLKLVKDAGLRRDALSATLRRTTSTPTGRRWRGSGGRWR